MSIKHRNPGFFMCTILVRQYTTINHKTQTLPGDGNYLAILQLGRGSITGKNPGFFMCSDPSPGQEGRGCAISRPVEGGTDVAPSRDGNLAVVEGPSPLMCWRNLCISSTQGDQCPPPETWLNYLTEMWQNQVGGIGFLMLWVACTGVLSPTPLPPEYSLL